MNRHAAYPISLALLLFYSHTACALAPKTFTTKYSVIYYAEDKDIDDFLWRLGGQRIQFAVDSALATQRVDRIVERVETILDMRPQNFNVSIYLSRSLVGPNKAAFYEQRTKSIHISVEHASDGILGHEIAHAVIGQYFASPPPSKVQEILTQYVDKYLWSDY